MEKIPVLIIHMRMTTAKRVTKEFLDSIPQTRNLQSLLQNRPLFLAICPGSLWARDNRWLLSRVQRLAGPAGGTGAFCPGLRHQPGQNGSLLSRLVVPTGTKGPRSLLSRLEPPAGTKVPPFVPVGASNRDKRPCAPYPLPSPPARAIQLTCFLDVLGSG